MLTRSLKSAHPFTAAQPTITAGHSPGERGVGLTWERDGLRCERGVFKEVWRVSGEVKMVFEWFVVFGGS